MKVDETLFCTLFNVEGSFRREIFMKTVKDKEFKVCLNILQGNIELDITMSDSRGIIGSS